MDFREWLLWIAFPGAATTAALWFALVYGRKAADRIDAEFARWRKLPWGAKTVVAAFALAMIVHGSVKTNSPPPSLGAPLRMVAPGETVYSRVTAADVARGFKLQEVRYGVLTDYSMPSNGVTYQPWNLRGAYDDAFRFGFGDWRFLLGNGELSSVTVFTSARIRPEPRDAVHEIAAVNAPMSAVPSLSDFWTADGPGDALRLTWRNFFRNRDTNTPVNAQIELRPGGGFVTREDFIERIYRRVDPDDVDDDGIPNDEDDDPYGNDGSYFGPRQTLPEGANSNAYYEVELVVEGGKSLVEFTGDGYSDLPDPSFIALPGVTNRVKLLIGKTYEVASRLPITRFAVSDPEVGVEMLSDFAYRVCWPVYLSEGWPLMASPHSGIGLMGGGAPLGMLGGLLGGGPLGSASSGDDEIDCSFTMFVIPSWLGGTFSWTNQCCTVSEVGFNVFRFNCSHCRCGGCQAEGAYEYEGYCLPALGGWCWCGYEIDEPWPEDDDGPYAAGASVRFSESAVIFEDSYTNMPGLVVARRSSLTTLCCSAHGGANGVTVTFSLGDSNRLVRVWGPQLPITQYVPPGQKLEFEIDYEGVQPSSSEGDVIAAVEGLEDTTGSPIYGEDNLTSVKVELTAVYEAPENKNPHRHVFGVGEQVEFMVTPSMSEVLLCVGKYDSGDMTTLYDTFEGEDDIDASAVRTYTCPVSGTVPNIAVCYDDVQYVPVLTVLEPQCVVTPVAIGKGRFVPGQVVMGCLMTTNYIGPMTVSFRGIQVFEVPCTNAIPPSGYFATTNYTGRMSHDFIAGAGIAHTIGAENYWAMDEAGHDEPYQNWEEGRLVWMIPIGWRRILPGGERTAFAMEQDYELFGDYASRPLLIGNSESKYVQIYLIDSDGTSSVEKFGFKLERGRWNIWGTLIQQ